MTRSTPPSPGEPNIRDGGGSSPALPDGGRRERHARGVAMGICACFVLSACLLAVAPLVMPDSYSWLEHGTSESAAQGLERAWVARMGFILFGLGVIWLATLRSSIWGPLGTALHVTFGVCMFGVAAFPTRPWNHAAPYLSSEDSLHTLFASVMGFAFIAGVIAVMVAKKPSRRVDALPELSAALLAVVLSLAMANLPDIYGPLQRTMFVVAYLWYGYQAVQVARLPPPFGATESRR